MEDRRSSAARLMASSSRVDLLHLLQQEGPSTIDALAQTLGLHANTVREHLARLTELDYVRREAEVRTTRGRPRMVYRATSSSDVLADPEAQARLNAAIAQTAFTSALMREFVGVGPDVADRATTAGRSIGRGLGATEEPHLGPAQNALPAPGSEREVLALEAHLDSFGFDPQLDSETLTFHLWRCPFLEMAKERPDVVCSVHKGLAQGVLEQAGGGLEVSELRPFVGLHHCTLTLRGASPQTEATSDGTTTRSAASL